MVLLKRLSDAVRDGDTVHALILGSAVNNDGAAKIGYTAPSSVGQADVVIEAHAVAGVSADTIGYVEAHGTGTRMGDPIEVEGLTRAFRVGTDRRQYCALGSIKTNIGHLDAAAGIAGLIKAALVVRDGVVPASLHYEAPNPAIDFAETPFRVAGQTTGFPTGAGPRRAGVSAFGIGGTNAHVVLEQPPAPARDARPDQPEQTLLLSARSPEALAGSARELARRLTGPAAPDLADAAATLAGRQPLEYRRSVVAREHGEAARLLTAPATPERSRAGRSAVYVLPGQGAGYRPLGLALYRNDPVFRGHLDGCAALLAEHGVDLLATLRDPAGSAEQPTAEQPALFAVGYALAAALRDHGIRPAAVLGHSLGEYVAATLAGVFALPDALRLVVARGELCGRLPAGQMLGVALPAEQLAPLLPDGVELTAVNAPDRCVVAGGEPAVTALAARLRERGVAIRLLAVSRAFHTAAVVPVLAEFGEVLSGVPMGAPRLPYVSGLTGDWVDPDQVCRPGYWLAHLRRPVRFADGVGRLLALGPVAVVEAGPAQGLEALVRRHPDFTAEHRSLRVQSGTADAVDGASLAPVLGQLWATGCPVDWSSVHRPPGTRRLRCPVAGCTGSGTGSTRHRWRCRSHRSPSSPPACAPRRPATRSRRQASTSIRGCGPDSTRCAPRRPRGT